VCVVVIIGVVDSNRGGHDTRQRVCACCGGG